MIFDLSKRRAFQCRMIDHINEIASTDSVQLECPSCHGPVFVPADSHQEPVTCASCGIDLATRRNIAGNPSLVEVGGAS